MKAKIPTPISDHTKAMKAMEDAVEKKMCELTKMAEEGPSPVASLMALSHLLRKMGAELAFMIRDKIGVDVFKIEREYQKEDEWKGGANGR